MSKCTDRSVLASSSSPRPAQLGKQACPSLRRRRPLQCQQLLLALLRPGFNSQAEGASQQKNHRGWSVLLGGLLGEQNRFRQKTTQIGLIGLLQNNHSQGDACSWERCHETVPALPISVPPHTLTLTPLSTRSQPLSVFSLH